VQSASGRTLWVEALFLEEASRFSSQKIQYFQTFSLADITPRIQGGYRQLPDDDYD